MSMDTVYDSTISQFLFSFVQTYFAMTAKKKTILYVLCNNTKFFTFFNQQSHLHTKNFWLQFLRACSINNV